MNAQYSQWSAFKALTRASLKSIFKSPSAIVFSIAFPMVFILVFGLAGGGGSSIRVGLDTRSDTANALYNQLKTIPSVKLEMLSDSATIKNVLMRGDLPAVLKIEKTATGHLNVTTEVSAVEQDKARLFALILKDIVYEQAAAVHHNEEPAVTVAQPVLVQGRKFKRIDFILPGQLGFSLLASGVFGTAFVFFNLRQTLVLKRFFATPISRSVIILSEGLARMVFQMMGAILIILIGRFVFDYTLVEGPVTFFKLLLVCAIAQMIFMGFGFIISSIARSESTIPPLSNIITLPQFLLAGTFFPIESFPGWLQPICKIMPLTYLNNALRKIAFDGAGLWDIRWELLVLVGWGVLIYAVASRVFKWE